MAYAKRDGGAVVRQVEVPETESNRPMYEQVDTLCFDLRWLNSFFFNICLRQWTDISRSLFSLVVELALRMFSGRC